MIFQGFIVDPLFNLGCASQNHLPRQIALKLVGISTAPGQQILLCNAVEQSNKQH